MKESVGSLRAFFIIVGLFGLLGGGAALLGSLLLVTIKPLLAIFLIVVMGGWTLLSLGYLYCGIALPTLLRTNPSMIMMVIMINLGFQVVSFVVNLVQYGVTGAGMVGAAFGFLINIYLLNSVKRLASTAY